MKRTVRKKRKDGVVQRYHYGSSIWAVIKNKEKDVEQLTKEQKRIKTRFDLEKISVPERRQLKVDMADRNRKKDSLFSDIDRLREEAKEW